MGKSKAAVRMAFEKVPKKIGEKQNKFRCGYCHWLTAENASRMTQHVIKCVNMPENIKRSLVKVPLRNQNESQPIKNEIFTNIEQPDESLLDKSLDSEGKSGVKPLSHYGAMTIQSYNNVITDDDQIFLTKKLARAIYASGSPFSVVENSYWNDFFKTLCPPFVPPSTFDVSSSLLDAEYSEIKQKCSNVIAATTHLGLQCHGWSNNSGDSMVNFIVTTPHPILFKSITTNMQHCTTKYMANLMLSVINDIGPQKVTGIVTDNASNMKVTWSLVKAVYPHINIYGCVDHALSLIMQDVLKIKELSRIMDDTKQIVNFINNGSVVRTIFNNKQQRCKESTAMMSNNHMVPTIQTLKLPVKTRLGSTVISLNSMLNNEIALRQLVDEEAASDSFKTIDGETVKANISSDTFWQEILHIRNLLEPIYKWMTIMRSDKKQISYVCKTFEDIAKNFSLAVENGPWNLQRKFIFCQIISDRSKLCITTLHKSANLLDPRMCGEDLSEDDFHEASQFIYDQARVDDNLDESQVMADLAAFRTKSGAFAATYLWSAVNQIEPSTWWKAYCSQRQLSTIAVRILDLPPTSSAPGITLWTQESVQSKTKNKIKNEQVLKALYVRHNLQLFSNKAIQEKANEKTLPTETARDYEDNLDKFWKNFNEAESEQEYIDEEWLEEI